MSKTGRQSSSERSATVSSIPFDTLRKEVLEANLDLVRHRLVLYTFGNASGISRSDGVVAIKPSGVPYEQLRAEDMVLRARFGLHRTCPLI